MIIRKLITLEDVKHLVAEKLNTDPEKIELYDLSELQMLFDGNTMEIKDDCYLFQVDSLTETKL